MPEARSCHTLLVRRPAHCRLAPRPPARQSKSRRLFAAHPRDPLPDPGQNLHLWRSAWLRC